jgi:hypothetical protein
MIGAPDIPFKVELEYLNYLLTNCASPSDFIILLFHYLQSDF